MGSGEGDAWEEHARELTDFVIAKYKRSLDALAHRDGCSTCETWDDIQAHLAKEDDPAAKVDY